VANDNSDYNLPRTKLHELLPEPYLSDVNRSVFENLFNRFLTKPETRKVAGYVGEGNPDAIVSRQIPEPTIHRQGWQLQPILYNKVGSVEHMASWQDIINELERLGVDVSRLPEWGETQVFNWVPPIDIDKLIHYQDYFWVDPSDPTSQPQYLTIRSRCETATAAANFHQRLVDEFGENFPISNIGAADAQASFTILSINTGGEFIRVQGDATTQLSTLDWFNVTGTVSNNGEYQILSAPVYDSINGWTTFDVGPGVLFADESIGTVNTQWFDKLIIPGEYIRLLEPGFVFFFKNSNNAEINDSFMTVVDSTYDSLADVTTIITDVTFSDSGALGSVSLEEQLNIFLAERDCQCTGSVGWDIFNWDDNPDDPLWDGDLVPLIASISNPGPPVGTPADGTLWFDTDVNQLHQYSLATGWKLLYSNFQTILDATEGLALWDFTPGCGEQSVVDAADQWIDQNHWVHKTDVVNFSIAKQAALPIIEFDWDLELNEWTFIEHTWKYRRENFNTFADTDASPYLNELIPFVNWANPTPFEIVLNEQYGDQTDWYTPGSFFQTTDTSEILEVVSSKYEQDVVGQPFKTKITVTVDVTTTPLVPGTSPLRPFRTSQNDPWKNYHDHWLYVKAETTTATNHQALNPFIEGPISPVVAAVDFATLGAGTDGEYTTTPYSQTYTIETATPLTTFLLDSTNPLGWDRGLNRMSLANQDDIRVYINDTRVFGTYEEIIDTEVGVYDPVTTISEDVDYVGGITFIAGFEPQQFDSIRIEVGEASIKEFGSYAVPVRTIETNQDFENTLTGGTRTISLVECRRAEQVKTATNQYPLFDIYNSDGTPANIANSIFAFQTSPDAPVAGEVGLRIVVDATGTDYSFEQFLCDPDTSALWAYRDYSNEASQYWVNPETNEVKFWTGLTWSDKAVQGFEYTTATVDQYEPASPFTGQIWFDTFNNELKEYDGASFVVVPDVDIDAINYDVTLQTIWRKGLNDETYVPALVDWKNRTESEYDEQMEEFIDARVVELRQADPTLTIPQATTQATQEWFTDQSNDLSPTGVWVGDWEVPDPLYYNNQHENRKVLTSSELLTHFNSIISSQPDLPGYQGPDSARFHLIPTENVNYGLGGTIHEYNEAWDTFLSSIFVNNVTPPTLYEFANDQYATLLNTLKESFRDDSITLLTTTSTESLIDFTSFAQDIVLTSFENNDNAAFLYGDSTTFTEVIGGPDLGIRNWIATLPYLNLAEPRDPELVTDRSQGINQIIHHDGHRNDYAYAPAVLDGIARLTINQVDTRSSAADPRFGRLSNNLPPNNITEFATEFGEGPAGRPGVYWYSQLGQARVLYRLEVASISVTEPSVSLADGTLWMDMTPSSEVLRVKNGASWDVVSGNAVGDGRFHNGTNPSDITTSTISAWKIFDLNAILGGIILEAEERLYGNVPATTSLDYDFSSLQDTPAKTALYNQLLEDRFFSFTRQSEIVAPLINGDFDQLNPFTWNYKRSTPGIGFEILNAEAATSEFTIDGNVTGSFPPASTFFIKNSGVNDGQWTVVSSINSGSQTIITVVESVTDSLQGAIYKGTLPTPENTGAESGGDWKDYYNKLYGTPYPHLEPWKLQRYVDKPLWWDAEYKNDDTVTYGNRRWKYIHSTTTGMWENIRLGIVPVGELLPDGVTVSTGVGGETTLWSYFSVNIDDVVRTADGGVTNYAPDAILPPLWDYLAAGEPAITNLRSVFQSFSVEIVSPAADYAFGDAGPIEFDWRVSGQFLYDQLTVAFQMDPVHFTAAGFGFDYDVIDQLEIDERTEQTPCHCRTEWHGEVVNDDLYQVNGFNQWYVNYNRFLGFDTSLSDFRSLWTLWTAPMMYQFSSFVDSTSLQVAHRTVPMSEFDYRLASKRSPGAEDYWLDAFKVTLLSIPPNLARYDNQLDWQLEVDTNSPLNRTIEHYDVHNYQFSADPDTDICTMYSYPMQELDFFNETFSVRGDQTIVFAFGREFDIVDSFGNDGSYTVVSSVYDATTDLTIIQIGDAISSAVVGGNLVANYRSVPWESGDSIWFSTEETLPSPLKGDQVGIGPTRYFVIKLSESTFQVANTQQNALSGLPIDITSSGRKNSFVGELVTTFFALDKSHTDTLWRHYKIDKTNILSFTPPNDIRGMQTLINIVDGYESFSYDEGFRTNDLKQQVDPDTGRFVDWQLECERFIDFAYTQRLTRNRNVANRYPVSFDDTADTFTYTAEKPGFSTGTAVNVLSSNTIMPAPIIPNLKYYMIVVNDTDFQLATTRQNAYAGVAVDLLPSPGVGDVSITAATDFRLALPSQSINPFRNALFFRPERGIVSNLLTGPSEDIRNTQLLFDQYGRPLNRKQMRILREDEQTQVMVIDEIPNDVELTSVFRDPYNYIHLGGAHIFIDAFEHVLIFNNYTSEDNLLYDPFLGLNVTKFELLFNRQVDFTQRPNVGGSYFKTFFNQGAELLDNFESSVSGLRNLYDSYRVIEAKPAVRQARKSLGYEGTRDYLDNMNLNEKSQFLFWRGLIQTKGSIQSVNAFVNSRRFIDAKVDEFWAYKLADFGATGDQEYPEMYLTTLDARTSDLRLQFIEEGDFCVPGFGEGGFDDTFCGFDIGVDDAINIEDGFTPIIMTDQARWFNQPDQLAVLRNNGLAFYFDLKPIDRIPVTIDAVAPTDPSNNDGWIRIVSPTGREFNRWNADDLVWENHGVWDTTTEFPILRHDFVCDNEIVQIRTVPEGARSILISGTNGEIGTSTSSTRTGPDISDQVVGFEPGLKNVVLPIRYIPFTGHLTVFKNGTEMDVLTEYVQTVDGFGLVDHNEIIFVEALEANDVVTVVYNNATLLRDVHYTRVSSNALALTYNTLVDDTYDITLWGQIVNEDAQTPAKIIDKDAGTVISPVQIWDPARGFQYQTAGPIVQLEMPGDPAVYTDTIETNQTPPGSNVRPYILYNDPWNVTEVGTTWLDTSNLDYKHYYDEQAIPDLDTRLRFWGQLADWGELKISEWVESDVPPAEYDAIAETEEGDRDIPEHERKAGRARKSTFESLDAGVTWIPLVNKYQEFDVIIEGVLGLPNEYDFTLDLTPANNNILLNDFVDIYVNGRLVESQRQITSAVQTVTDLNEADRVRFVKPVPDTVTIEADPNMQEVYEYTTVPDFDEFGQPTSKYYFWVEDKGTRNKKQSISPRDAQTQMINIPAPYMLTQKALPADVRTNGVLADLEREWTHIITDDDRHFWDKMGSRQIILVGSHVKDEDIANIDVFVNNIQLLSGTEYALSESGREVEITLDWLTSRQTEVNYDGGLEQVWTDSISPPGYVAGTRTNGTFIGGNNYAVDDTITLDDGSILQVTSETGGTVDGFVFTLVSKTPVVTGVTLNQVISSGAGGGFNLTPEDPNTGLGNDDTVEFTYTTEIPTEVFQFPDRHTQAVVRGLRGLVTSDRRFTLRYVRDFTLRDNIENGTTPLQLKQAHEEWQLIREEQPFLIPRALWDKVTESMVGYLLTDPSVRVPSLERELYDASYNAETRFGLQAGQSFTDGPTALQTILKDLQDPENDFPSVDINTFFATHSFDTAENIVDAMDAIYETFTFTDVNRIWFAVLHDAFSFKKEYPDIFKTSMVAIHGIRPFQVAGLFDD
jgi:hypothetical protein